MDTDYLRDLADLCLRMLHVVAGIAWIGASFYFIRLDLGLAPPKEPKEGVAGEYWGVHGGGFYHSQKYKVAPPTLPEHLHWFKWEAYTTWLSGFALLVVLYWLDADTRLVDPTVADLSAWQAVALSAAGLALAWLIYDFACRLLIEDRLVAVAVDRARGGLRVRGGRALRRAGVVPPGRRDARDDHGRQRLLRDHPGAPRARPGEAGGPRAGPPAGAAREAALRAQQLPDAAGRVHDARRPLPARLRAATTPGSSCSRSSRSSRRSGTSSTAGTPGGATGGSSPRPASAAAVLAVVLAPDDADTRRPCRRRVARRSRSPPALRRPATPASRHRSASGS